jgi:hypothetical protein
MNHELTTLAHYYEKVISQQKTFEIRFNDRDFKVGDTLLLREHTSKCYTGRKIRMRVTYLLDSSDFPGVSPGYVCMSIESV